MKAEVADGVGLVGSPAWGGRKIGADLCRLGGEVAGDAVVFLCLQVVLGDQDVEVGGGLQHGKHLAVLVEVGEGALAAGPGQQAGDLEGGGRAPADRAFGR